MTTCANCTEEAVYDYVGTKYCEKHLPRFLRKGDNVPAPTLLNAPEPSAAEQILVEEPAEPVVEEPPAPAPKPKAKPKAEDAPEAASADN
jgi:hypothetical protein